MSLKLKIAINSLLSKFGFEIRDVQAPVAGPVNLYDFSKADLAIIEQVAPFTMTSPERIFSLCRSVEYIIKGGIPGDIVECGVWKGGSSMSMALTLLRLKNFERDLYMYDTYDTGWPEAEEIDQTHNGITAHELWLQAVERGETTDTLFAKIANVRDAMVATGYPMDKVHMVKGKVEDTIPGTVPQAISLLRLDTDWYASTKHELNHLYPLLSPGGVLMIDDYASFKGARKAVDEYFEEHNINMLLHRVDASGYRVGIKV